MPIYDYVCDNCGNADTEYQKMSSPHLTDCPACWKVGTYHRVPSLSHTDLKEFHTPIEMYSIALDTDDEIKAFKQRCPDVDVSLNPRDEMYGIPIARNRKQKLSALKTAGFAEKN